MTHIHSFKIAPCIQMARRGRWSSISIFIVAAVFYGVMGQSRTLVDSAIMVVPARNVASLRFPQVSNVSDEDEMIVRYMAYLQFVTSVGSEMDAANTKRLVHLYQSLRKRSRSGAALFLKGLRYEMIQRVELSGWNPYSITSNSPEMRQFIARYLSTWVREADEHLFRTYADQIAKRE